jgi:hypothetical protein
MKGIAKLLPFFVLIMADCVRQGGSRRGRGPSFGRRRWLFFRGWRIGAKVTRKIGSPTLRGQINRQLARMVLEVVEEELGNMGGELSALITALLCVLALLSQARSTSRVRAPEAALLYRAASIDRKERG